MTEADLCVVIDDQTRIAWHRAYVSLIAVSDPQRASILRAVLELTYRYEGVAAGDVLLAVDQELHGPVSSVA